MIIISILLLSSLFLFPEVATSGSKYGIQLWFTQLIPTLLPCLVLTKYLQQHTRSLCNHRLYLLLGILCGYPIGATLVATQYSKQLLSSRQAYFFLGFVNCASPGFVLLFCGINTLRLSTVDSFSMFLILLGCSSLSSCILTPFFPKQYYPSKHLTPSDTSQSFNEIITSSFSTLCLIGFYVCLCSICSQLLCYLLSINNIAKMLLSGFFEITLGMSRLQSLALSLNAKRVLALGLLGFGGISALLQTNSVLTKTELSIIPYLCVKTLTGILAISLGYLLFNIF